MPPLQANDPKFPVLPSPQNLITPSGSDVWGVLPGGHIISSCHEGLGGLISPPLFSLYINDMHTPSHHVELNLYADITAIIVTSCKPTLLVSYLESYLNDFQRWLSKCLEKHRDNLRACRTALHPAPTLRGANPMGRHKSISGSDPTHTRAR